MGNYDPSKAELGIFNRQAWTGQSKREKDTHTYESTYTVVDEDYDDFDDFDDYDDFDKEAAATDIWNQPDTALPRLSAPEPGGQNDQDIQTNRPTDLAVHGAHEYPAPNAKQLIKDRIRNLRVQVKGNKEKKLLQKQVEQQDQKSKAALEEGTDITIDRRQLERGFSHMSKRASSEEALGDDDLNPIKVMLILDDVWGEDWRDWEPETIMETAQQDGIEISMVNMGKLMALKVLFSNDEFFDDPRVFEKVCIAFSGRIVDWGHIQNTRLHEICSCIGLVERYIKEKKFSDDVATYVAASAIRDGFLLLPPSLGFADYPFSKELALNAGDDILEKQNRLIEAIKDEDPSILESDEAVQYMRILRVQFHTNQVIEEARA